MDFKVGDKFDVQHEVCSIKPHGYYLGTNPALSLLFLTKTFTEEVAKNIIRAPIKPAVGQVWQRKGPAPYKYTILFIDYKSALVDWTSSEGSLGRCIVDLTWFNGIGEYVSG